MIKARHQRFYVWLFKHYIPYIIHKHFQKVIVKGDQAPIEKPLLMIGNHFSWWDGFFAAYLNDHLYHKKIHVMMLEEQLQKHKTLNKVGAFGIRQKSRDILAGIKYSKEILTHPEHLLVMFPQGRFSSLYHYPVHFERGIGKIIEQTYPGCAIVFFSALIDYFSSKKPVLTLSVKQYRPDHRPSIAELEDAYNTHLQKSINDQKEE